MPYFANISALLASNAMPAANNVSNLGQIFSNLFNILGLILNNVDWFTLSSRNVDSRPSLRRTAKNLLSALVLYTNRYCSNLRIGFDPDSHPAPRKLRRWMLGKRKSKSVNRFVASSVSFNAALREYIFRLLLWSRWIKI